MAWGRGIRNNELKGKSEFGLKIEAKNEGEKAQS